MPQVRVLLPELAFVIDDLAPPEATLRAHTLCASLPFTRVRYGYRAAAAEPLSFGHQWVHALTEDERPLFPMAAIEATVQQLMGPSRFGRAHLNCILPADPRYPHLDSTTDDVIVAVWFVNATWPEAWAGELIFWEGGEARHAVAPRPGRLVVFRGDLVHRGGVPNANCPEPRYALAVKFKREAAP